MNVPLNDETVVASQREGKRRKAERNDSNGYNDREIRLDHDDDDDDDGSDDDDDDGSDDDDDDVSLPQFDTEDYVRGLLWNVKM